jgi:hypothetical protein
MGSLPSEWTNDTARSTVASLVFIARTTSTSFITGTGLKKCIPTKRSGRPVAAAISAIVRLEVFEAKIVSAEQIPSKSRNISDFTARSSTTASMMMEASARSLIDVVKLMRASAASRCSVVAFAFSMALSNDLPIAARALAQSSAETSLTIVLYPLAAHTCAMPEPIRPPPSTPTVSISFMDVRC